MGLLIDRHRNLAVAADPCGCSKHAYRVLLMNKAQDLVDEAAGSRRSG